MSNLVQEVEGALAAAEKAIEGEAKKVEHAVAAEAEKAADEVKVDVKKAVEDVRTALAGFVTALKTEADRVPVIHELEITIERLKHPVDAAVLAADAEATKAAAEAKEDAMAIAGPAARTWHRLWAWL
jgi:hypothetical protein